MSDEYFAGIGRIPFEGPDSTNPLAFRYYQPDRMVLGKPMAEHLRPAVCYWHNFCWGGQDTFGHPTFPRPWTQADTVENAKRKLDVAFEFFAKLGTPYFCFHDVDLVPLGETLAEGARNLEEIVPRLEDKMRETGVRLLWGTANLVAHPRYMAGAATSPEPEVFAFAAGQVRQCLELTQRLGGTNYVLWGGREGYETLLNTDLAREQDQLGRFLAMVVEHKHKIGFDGTILVEPKPCEPTKHQYDHDAAAVHAFLRKYDLQDDVRLNIEVNHATLAGHSFEHEVAYAAANGLLGSFDINRGDLLLGWDTDQFPDDPKEIGLALYRVLKAGGLATGGFNFDAKLRRQSTDPVDMFHAHIGGLDALARGLLLAERLIQDDPLGDFVGTRYANWDTGLGADIRAGRHSLASLADHARDQDLAPRPPSGRQEYLEALINRYLY